MRYMAIISYNGARFVGWQRQKNGLSVQEELEKGLSKTFAIPVKATASGRTDAGVHAEGQVVHFDVTTSIPVEKIPYAVNVNLPDDISMLYCEQTDDTFNARFSAKRKTYCYKLYLANFRRPLLEATHEQITVPLDRTAMYAVAREIEGEHDFKCFEAAGSKIKNTVRTVYSIKIDVEPLKVVPLPPPNPALECVPKTLEQIGDDIFECTVDISVTGNGFLYNMVRIIAGTLVYAGMGKLSVEDVKKALLLGDRKKVGKTLPAKGLHLMSVKYHE